MSNASEILARPLQIYKDCLRAARQVSHSYGVSEAQMKRMIRAEFEKNKHLSDEEEVNNARWHAVKALHNYLMHQSGYTEYAAADSGSAGTDG